MQWLSNRCCTVGTLIKFGGAPVAALLDWSGSNLVHWVGPHILLNCSILPSSVDSVATYSWKKPQNYVCWWRHLSSSRISRTWVHIYKPSPIQQYQTCFLTPTASWLYGIHKLMMSFQKHDGQKTNKKTSNFLLPWWHAKLQSPSPTKLGMVIEEVRPKWGSLKHVTVRLIVLPLGGVEIVVETPFPPAWLNPLT